PPVEDILMHLMVTGGLLLYPFKEPLFIVMTRIQPAIHYDNTEQRPSNGEYLETLTVVAIMLASHAGGVAGRAFPRCFGRRLFKLGLGEQSEVIQLIQDFEKAGGL
ncbi:hypothetical protein PHMEG_00017690, partial [Phytophthora megakarya]